jgi:hypothetical protein
MENTKKSLSDSILELIKSSPNVSDSVSDAATTSVGNAVTETGSGIFGLISSISWLTWLVIILILAFLGFNIFSYLAEGTEGVSNILGPLFKKIVGLIYGTANQTIDVAAEGGKAATNSAASGINKGLSAVQDVTPNNSKSSVSSIDYEKNKEENEESKNSLNNILENSNKKNRNTGKEDEYEPNQASSSVHETGKAGWCFIGEDRGYRTCSKVGKDDKCMSGDIFPTQQLCINPNLRA